MPREQQFDLEQGCWADTCSANPSRSRIPATISCRMQSAEDRRPEGVERHIAGLLGEGSRLVVVPDIR